MQTWHWVAIGVTIVAAMILIAVLVGTSGKNGDTESGYTSQGMEQMLRGHLKEKGYVTLPQQAIIKKIGSGRNAGSWWSDYSASIIGGPRKGSTLRFRMMFISATNNMMIEPLRG